MGLGDLNIVHEGIKKYNCKVCNRSFGTSSHLKHHLKTVHEKNFKCEFCEKCFGLKMNMIKHINIVHKGMKQFNCTINSCEKVFCTIIGFTKHVQSAHDVISISTESV